MLQQLDLGHLDDSLKTCIETCLACHTMCLSTAHYSLTQREQQVTSAAHVTLLLDCAEICQTSANFMLRSSVLHTRTCRVCAEICDLCAMDCQRFVDDPRMQACADVCRRCAVVCRQMLEAMATI